MKGLQIILENPMGFTACRLHYSADPSKDPENPDPALAERAREWITAQRRSYPDPNDFEREMEINFHVGKGRRVFPQFNETIHGRSLEYNRRRVIYRAWDFGWHAPVCLFSQVGTKDRLLLLREKVGGQLTTRDFAQQVIQLTSEWYPNHAAGFEDYCDPAGQYVKSIESERSEKRDSEVLESLGIFPKCEFGWSRKDGRALIHELLQLRLDTTPGVYIDPAGCPLLVRALLGQYVFKETKDGRVHDEPDDETHPWADVIAALRYLVTGVRRMVMGHRAPSGWPTKTAELTYHGYGVPVRPGRKVNHVREG